MSYEILSVGDQPNNNGTNGNLSTEPEEANTPEVTPPAGNPEEANAPAVEVTDDPSSQDNPDAPEAGSPEYYFDGGQVEVTVPDDIAAAFAEKGIDSNKVLSELFAKDGKFELTAETKSLLDEKFGKGLVDGYLNLFKQQNEMAVKQYKSEADAATKLQSEITSDFTDLVGGDDGWNELDKWAESNMSDSELASFNAVMSLPPTHWAAQRAVIEALQIKRGAVTEKAEGTGMGKLIGDDGEAGSRATGGLPSTLTMAEFHAQMATDKYRKDPQYAARIDAIRRASKQSGIA